MYLACLAVEQHNTSIAENLSDAVVFARLEVDDFIDVIFNSGNGISPVDDEWFAHAVDGQVLGRSVKLYAPEELIWAKAFIMERERYDGADVAHILRAQSARLDWTRLLRRFGAAGVCS